MTNETKHYCQMGCLYDEEREQLTKRILNDPRDVSHKWYSELFKDFDWEAYEREKAKAQKQVNSDT